MAHNPLRNFLDGINIEDVIMAPDREKPVMYIPTERVLPEDVQNAATHLRNFAAAIFDRNEYRANKFRQNRYLINATCSDINPVPEFSVTDGFVNLSPVIAVRITNNYSEGVLGAYESYLKGQIVVE